jgi:hypothetical protein
MAVAYAGLAVGGPATPVLVGLLAVGGLGFGFATTAVLTHLTTVAPASAAADISGLYNTNSQLAAVAGLAVFGSLYLSLAADPTRAFVVVCLAFATSAGVAALAADRGMRRSPTSAALAAQAPQAHSRRW